MAHMAASVTVRELVHAYGTQRVVRGLGFTLEPGAWLPARASGWQDHGPALHRRLRTGGGRRDHASGRVASTPGMQIPPELRGIGMVFQDYALFPHLSVAGNVAFGLSAPEWAARRARQHARAGRPGRMADVYPHEPGGQQQRAAGTGAGQAGLLLLDEPFSNLDVDLRERLRSKSARY
jgi:iron(III) transport system ATP-binding protein